MWVTLGVTSSLNEASSWRKPKWVTKGLPVYWVSPRPPAKGYVPWGFGLVMSGIITKVQSLHNDTFSDGHLLSKGWGKLNNTTRHSTWNFLKNIIA